jgi:hypothetical protein
VTDVLQRYFRLKLEVVGSVLSFEQSTAELSAVLQEIKKQLNRWQLQEMEAGKQ